MSETFDEILGAPLSLSPGARAMLAGNLLECLDREKAERRVQAIQDGKVQTIDGELVMRELRERRGR